MQIEPKRIRPVVPLAPGSFRGALGAKGGMPKEDRFSMPRYRRREVGYTKARPSVVLRRSIGWHLLDRRPPNYSRYQDLGGAGEGLSPLRLLRTTEVRGFRKEDLKDSTCSAM